MWQPCRILPPLSVTTLITFGKLLSYLLISPLFFFCLFIGGLRIKGGKGNECKRDILPSFKSKYKNILFIINT